MKERRLFIDGFALKIVAMVTMTLSHIGFMMVTQGYFGDSSVPYNTGLSCNMSAVYPFLFSLSFWPKGCAKAMTA